MRRRLLPNRKSLQPPSIHQKNIQPSVVVVIVESHPAACRFQQIFIFVLPTKNSFGVQPRLFCNIQKTQSQGTSRNRSSSSRRGGDLLNFAPHSLDISRTRETQNVFEREDRRGTAQRLQKRAA